MCGPSMSREVPPVARAIASAEARPQRLELELSAASFELGFSAYAENLSD